jgi:hypothetical protein
VRGLDHAVEVRGGLVELDDARAIGAKRQAIRGLGAENRADRVDRDQHVRITGRDHAQGAIGQRRLDLGDHFEGET